MFAKWLDTLVEEKGLELDEAIETHFGTVSLSFVVEHMKIASREEQQQIKTILVKIDFLNGDVMDFFRHCAGALETQASEYIAIC